MATTWLRGHTHCQVQPTQGSFRPPTEAPDWTQQPVLDNFSAALDWSESMAMLQFLQIYRLDAMGKEIEMVRLFMLPASIRMGALKFKAVRDMI